ncbi:transmembrane protein 164 isoform X5 [Cervus elaphus]|uniref:transmembrane protein 164 isoform X5 n=1 Tax=Cervus elaphus TaxID=9860 RepID=UPI001CC2AAD9|nr:transmembrane protein 164 isoform X5 [Cervus elaphus]
MIFHRVAVWVRISDLASFHLCTMRQPYGGGEPWERLALRLAAPPLPGLPWPFASRKSDPSQVPFLDHQRGAMGQPSPPPPPPIPSATVNFPEAWWLSFLELVTEGSGLYCHTWGKYFSWCRALQTDLDLKLISVTPELCALTCVLGWALAREQSHPCIRILGEHFCV